MNDHERLLQIIKDMAEEEKEVRGLARQVLIELEVYGDDNGVPTIADVVELLVKKIRNESRLSPEDINAYRGYALLLNHDPKTCGCWGCCEVRNYEKRR